MNLNYSKKIIFITTLCVALTSEGMNLMPISHSEMANRNFYPTAPSFHPNNINPGFHSFGPPEGMHTFNAPAMMNSYHPNIYLHHSGSPHPFNPVSPTPVPFHHIINPNNISPLHHVINPNNISINPSNISIAHAAILNHLSQPINPIANHTLPINQNNTMAIKPNMLSDNIASHSLSFNSRMGDWNNWGYNNWNYNNWSNNCWGCNNWGYSNWVNFNFIFFNFGSYPYYPYPYPYPNPYNPWYFYNPVYYYPGINYYPYPNVNNYNTYNYYNSAATSSKYSSTNQVSKQANSIQWIQAKNGDVPSNAILYQYKNNKSSYFCRNKLDKKIYYGILYPNDGCYISTQNNTATIRFEQYQVKVSTATT